MVNPMFTDVNYRPAGTQNPKQVMNIYVPANPTGLCLITYDLAGFTQSGTPPILDEGGPMEVAYNAGAVIVDASVTISDQISGDYQGGGMFWRTVDPEWDIDGGGDDIPQLDACWVVQHVKQNAVTYGVDVDKIFVAGRSASSDLAGFVATSLDLSNPVSAFLQSRQSTRVRGLNVELTQAHFDLFGKLSSLGVQEDYHHRDSGDTSIPAIDGVNTIPSHVAASSWGRHLVAVNGRALNSTLPIYMLTSATGVPGHSVIGPVDYSIDPTTYLPNMSGTTTTGVIDVHDAIQYVLLRQQLALLSPWHATHSRLASQLPWTVAGVTPDFVTTAGLEYADDFVAWMLQAVAEEDVAGTFGIRMEWANGWNVERAGMSTDARGGMVQRRQTQSAFALGSGSANARSWALRWKRASKSEGEQLLALWAASHGGVRPIHFSPPEEPTIQVRAKFAQGTLSFTHINSHNVAMGCVLEEVV